MESDGYEPGYRRPTSGACAAGTGHAVPPHPRCDDRRVRSSVADLVERLGSTRSLAMLRLIDDAALEGAPPGLPEAGVVESYRWLLARVRDGVRLTQAGYLPPALVAETMQQLGWVDDWISKHNREDQTLPVLDLRDSAQRLGLLRKHRGTLLPTVAGRRVTDDPAGLW